MSGWLTKNHLIVSCGLLSLTLLGSSFVCQFVTRNNLPLFFVGRNLFFIGMACAGATFAYAGVECLNCLNEHCISSEYVDAETQTIEGDDLYYLNHQSSIYV